MEDRYEGHTEGPWMWHGVSNKVCLCTGHSGRLLILDVEHRPVAPPSLRLRTPECLMQRLQEFARPDHNGEFFEVDHPDARLIADAWRLPALERELAAARAIVAPFEKVIALLEGGASTSDAEITDAIFEGLVAARAAKIDAARAEGDR